MTLPIISHGGTFPYKYAARNHVLIVQVDGHEFDFGYSKW